MISKKLSIRYAKWNWNITNLRVWQIIWKQLNHLQLLTCPFFSYHYWQWCDLHTNKVQHWSPTVVPTSCGCIYTDSSIHLHFNWTTVFASTQSCSNKVCRPTKFTHITGRLLCNDISVILLFTPELKQWKIKCLPLCYRPIAVKSSHTIIKPHVLSSDKHSNSCMYDSNWTSWIINHTLTHTCGDTPATLLVFL